MSVVIDCAIGSAIGDGASFSFARTITCSISGTIAEGKTLSVNRTINCVTGNITADGVGFHVDRSLQAAIGNAIADGAQANINARTEAQCTPGAAKAGGLRASINHGKLNFTANYPGDYIIEIEAFPYQKYTQTITAS